MRFLSILGLLVCSRLFAGPAAASPSADFPLGCNLPAPANLQITGVTPTTVTASWSAVTGASAYHATVTEQVSGLLVASQDFTTLFGTVSGLTAGTAYLFNVQAIDGTGCISQNKATAAFLTPFIITDETIVKMPVPTTTTGCITTVVQDSANFGIKAANSIAEPFVIAITTGNSGTELRVKHDNRDCRNGYQCYQAGWHFGNGYSNPPLVPWTSADQNATIVRCYNLPSSLYLGSAFPTPTCSITVSYFSNPNGSYTVTLCTQEGCMLGVANGSLGKPATDRSSGETRPGDSPVSPNPFDDRLAVRLSAKPGQSTVLQLFGANGSLVCTQRHGETDEEAIIRTEDLAPGLYILRIETADETRTYKVVKAGS